jgi:hypothetical protein
MKNIFAILAITLLLGQANLCAQEVEDIKTSTDKKKIDIRPNSRDYGAVTRDNQQQRVVPPKNKQMFVHKRPVVAKKKAPIVKPGQEVNKTRQNQIRKQKIQERRALRK